MDDEFAFEGIPNHFYHYNNYHLDRTSDLATHQATSHANYEHENDTVMQIFQEAK
jgi:hypothetical protein